MFMNKYFLLFFAFSLCFVKEVNAQILRFSTIDENSPSTEIATIVMKEAFRRLHHDMQVVFFPGARELDIVNKGEVDGELYRMEGLEKVYKNLVRVPVVITNVEFVVFSKNSNLKIENWEGLKPYLVGYQRGIKAIEINLVKGTATEVVTTMDQAMMKLQSKRTDIVVDDRLAGVAALKRLGLKSIFISEPPLLGIPLFAYLHKKNIKILPELTDVLVKMEKEGFIQKVKQQIHEKYSK